jgi:hypothetical protein
MRLRPARTAAPVAVALLLLAACGDQPPPPVGTTPTPTPDDPVIDEFSVGAASVFRGSVVELSWSVSGDVDRLTLTSDRGHSQDVTGTTEATVTVPTDKPTVTFTLTAVNDETGESDAANTPPVSIELWICSDPADVIDVPDPELEAALRATSVIPVVGAIACADMQALVTLNTGHFEGNEGGIVSLDGLQHAVNLEVFVGQSNLIGDIAPLATLVGLTHINLDKNAFNDITPLSDLVALEVLSLWDVGPEIDEAEDGIADIDPISGLTALRELYLSSNAISDISPLADLTDLEVLFLIDNQIGDISPLAGLTELETLRLGFNQVADVSVLAGLANLVWVELPYNQVADVSAFGAHELLWALELEGNFVADIGPLAGNTEFPADAGTGREQEPADPTLSVGYNCLDNDPGSAASDDVEELEGREVVVIGFDTQRDECVMGAALDVRELRLQEFRQAPRR